MSKLTLDLNGLNVESFSPEGTMSAAGEPTTGTLTVAFACDPDSVMPMSLTHRVCCMVVEACTVKEPCCVVTP